MARDCFVLIDVLHIRRLQLGLVVAARFTAVYEAQIARNGGERTESVSHRRMVSSRELSS